MVNEIRYTNIRRVLDNIHDHPMLADLTLEQAVRHVLRFISLHGYNRLYQDKIEDVDIHEFRGMLPCDLIRIIQVRDVPSGICLRAMTDNFNPGLYPESTPQPPHHRNLLNNIKEERMEKDLYIPPMPHPKGEFTFKTQGRVIYTSFPEGRITVSYKAIPVDDDGFPLLIDDETYLGALEAYIKKQIFTVKFDTGKIAAGVLQNAQKDYAVLAKELQSDFLTPSLSEAEALSRAMTHILPRVREFDNGFQSLGDREYLKKH